MSDDLDAVWARIASQIIVDPSVGDIVLNGVQLSSFIADQDFHLV